MAGTAGLSAGLRIAPDAEAEVPLPKSAARAGVDFASDRFVVLFESQPGSAAIAPYLDGDPTGTGSDLVRAQDNALLVQHPYLRKVSHNLAAKYSLREISRVFFKDVRFAVYETPQLQTVAELDALMKHLLDENPGLVREVAYDFFDSVEDLPPPPGRSQAKEPAPNTASATASELPALHPPPAAPDKKVASAPTYDNPDPYYLNQPGFDTDQGDGASDSGSWPLWRIGATLNEAWSYTTGSSAVVVAVIDTGARYTHEDLTENIINPQNDPRYNMPGVLTDIYNKDNDPFDDHGHGTFCAGEIAASGNNGKGAVGVCWHCTVLPIKSIGASGNGTDAQIAEGMLLADALGANIASMSLGGYFGNRLTQLAAMQCIADGMLICAGAGNYNSSAPFYPAYYPECLAIGASTLVNGSNNEDFSTSGGALPVATRYDARATFSCYGPWVDLVTPGVHCLGVSYASDSAYIADWSGTSMATPYASGCAALLWAYVSNPTSAKVRGLLQSGAVNMAHLNNAANPKGFLDGSGNGTVRFLNVLSSLELYDSGIGVAPSVSWDNPQDGSTVSGQLELRASVSGGSGTITKVEFETATRHLGTQTAPNGGFYRQDWDTRFEFNRPLELRARAYDDKGNISTATLTVTPSNQRQPLPWGEAFDSLNDNTIPGGWSVLDGNQGSGDTIWGADSTSFVSAGRSMHSSGSTAQYAPYSIDYLFAPVVDLRGFASAALSFQRRYQSPGGEAYYFLLTDDDRSYTRINFANTSMVDWGAYNLSLSSFAGREVRILWAVVNTGGVQAPGFWFDDLDLSAAAGTPPTITINSPAAGASVSGVVPVQLTVSDDTKWISLFAEPPDISAQWFSPIPDNDPGGPNKTFTINWDSRQTYRGGGMLTLTAWDDEDNDNNADDFSAVAAVPLSVTNPARNPVWFEGFENIGTLGGINNGNFDGDWAVWQFSTNTWRITSAASEVRTGAKACKFGPAGNGDYSANDFALLYSPVHNCSGATRPYLRFWHKLDVEDGTGDIARVYLTTYQGLDDVRVPLFEYRSDSAPANQWKEVDVDLARWKAEDFRLNFIFRADGDSGAGNVGKGWLIDDYEVLDANPNVTGLSPARGAAGASITVNGQRFGNVEGSSSVSFAKQGGGRVVASVNSWSNTSIGVTVPGNAANGPVVVSVLGFDSNGVDFKVVLAPPSLGGLNQL